MNVHPQTDTAANPLRRLRRFGQAVWVDFLSREFIDKGDLRKLIADDGLSGVTSNPAIFEKAIDRGEDYASALEAMLRREDCDVKSLYERLAIEDIQNAADVLRPVYETTLRGDGYVSLEVSPYLAMDTEATIAEARRLWSTVGRDNLMIKVPATEAGLPAIRRLIGEGINVNITLLFSQQVYEHVVEAYLAGLEDLLAGGGDPGRIASVASFFVSRIDVAVDRIIEERLHRTSDGRERANLTGATRKSCGCERKTRLSAFPAPLRRCPLGEAKAQWRARAETAVGEHGHQKSRLQRCALRGRAHWRRHREHDAARDDGCIPRSRNRVRFVD